MIYIKLCKPKPRKPKRINTKNKEKGTQTKPANPKGRDQDKKKGTEENYKSNQKKKMNKMTKRINLIIFL